MTTKLCCCDVYWPGQGHHSECPTLQRDNNTTPDTLPDNEVPENYDPSGFGPYKLRRVGDHTWARQVETADWHGTLLVHDGPAFMQVSVSWMDRTNRDQLNRQLDRDHGFSPIQAIAELRENVDVWPDEFWERLRLPLDEKGHGPK